jgi:glycosyltransferase involved in cell wall biosynthesis
MDMETPVDHGPDLSIVVPVYNEIDNIDPLIDRVCTTLDGVGLSWEFLAVDDGSTDGSGERLDEMAKSEERIRVLHFQENCGQSAGLDAGFKNARGRLVALLDADLQTYPEDLPKLIEMLESEKLDAVVGIRAERHDTGWKRFSSRFANGVRNRLTREDIQDTGCPIKVFRAEAIRSVKIFTGMHRFLPTLLRMEGFTIMQVPVRHTARTAGTSKYGTWDRAFSGLRDALAVRWMQDRRMKWRIRD